MAGVLVLSLSPFELGIGGVAAPAPSVGHARDVLRTSGGIMVRQPLRYARNPLAACDYHEVAAPYRRRLLAELPARDPRGGTGGRALTKTAFITALDEIFAEVGQVIPFAHLVAALIEGMAEDAAYAIAMAADASAILARSR